jgi:hypothetical protein
MSNSNKTDEGMPRSSGIPSAIIEEGLLSDTSVARKCFVYQDFSNKLQAFLVGYVNEAFSNYSIYK